MILFYFIGKSKFGSFSNHLSVIINLNNLSNLFWQQHKQLKTINMNEAWLDIYGEGYKYQF